MNNSTILLSISFVVILYEIFMQKLFTPLVNKYYKLGLIGLIILALIILYLDNLNSKINTEPIDFSKNHPASINFTK